MRALVLSLAIATLTAPQPIAQMPATAQMPDRQFTDAMRAIYGLRNYTAFDWIAGRYLRGTLTLEGFVRSGQLKQEAEAAARKAGIEVVENRLELLPTHSLDDDIRMRAYVAIYSSPGLERYAPGGQLSGAARREIEDAARIGLDAADVGRGPHAIHIIVSGGRVLLHGEVRSAGDRRSAEAGVRGLNGVLNVTNQVRVAGEKK